AAGFVWTVHRVAHTTRPRPLPAFVRPRNETTFVANAGESPLGDLFTNAGVSGSVTSLRCMAAGASTVGIRLASKHSNSITAIPRPKTSDLGNSTAPWRGF